MKQHDTHIPEKRFDMVANSVQIKVPLREGLKGGTKLGGPAGEWQMAEEKRHLLQEPSSRSINEEHVDGPKSRDKTDLI
jgi:hypothetical protein